MLSTPTWMPARKAWRSSRVIGAGIRRLLLSQPTSRRQPDFHTRLRLRFGRAPGYLKKYDPSMMNISSSVVTPPVRGHASQKPSPAPAVLSHEALRFAGVMPLHGARTNPLTQFVGVLHGPPKPMLNGGGGDVDWRFTSSGLTEPLS